MGFLVFILPCVDAVDAKSRNPYATQSLFTAAMVLGLIYGMVEHTYFMDLLILYAVLAAKFAVMFGVTWGISRAFRETLKPREKVDQKVMD